MANQWLLLYFLLIFGIGIFSLGIVTVAYIRVRDTALEYYLYFYGIFSLSLVSDTAISYIVANFSNIPPDSVLLVSLSYANAITVCALLFFIPVFTHELFACSHRTFRNRIAGAFAISCYLLYHTWIAMFCVWEKSFPSLGIVIALHIVAVVSYCAFLSIQYYRLSKHQPHRKSAGVILLFLLGTVGIILEDNLFDIIFFPMYPLVYAGCGLVFGAYFFSRHWPKYHAAVRSSIENTPEQMAGSDVVPGGCQITAVDSINSFDEFCKRFQLSTREKDVLLLLLQGQTNGKIAERLFISINTVKTHISNIYQKIGVSRRYELLTRCKNFSLPSLKEDHL